MSDIASATLAGSDGTAVATRVRMAVLANIAQNIAYGLTYGFFGTLLVPVVADFKVPTAVIVGGISIFGVVHGLLSPIVGTVAVRYTVRRLMVSGALLLSFVFVSMSLTTNAWAFMAIFGFLGAAAAACMGLTPVTMLLGQWFKEDRGKIFGLAMIPWLPMVAPVLGALAIEAFGWRATMQIMAAVAFAAAGILLLVRSPAPLPTDDDLVARKSIAPSGGGGRKWLPQLGEFKPDAYYWILAVLVSIMCGATLILLTYVPPFATSQGYSLSVAAALVSIQGLSGMVGAPLFGAVFDRLRGPVTLGIVAGLVAFSCGIFALGPSYTWMVVAATAAGLVGGAATPLLGAILSGRYPVNAIGPAMGLASFIMLPFISLLPMAAGMIVDRTGDYAPMFGFEVGLAICAGCACFWLGWIERKSVR